MTDKTKARKVGSKSSRPPLTLVAAGKDANGKTQYRIVQQSPAKPAKAQGGGCE